MQRNSLDKKLYVLKAASRLATKQGSLKNLLKLPIKSRKTRIGEWSWVILPSWAQDLVPPGEVGFFVPRQQLNEKWFEYDWWEGAYQMLTSQTERQHEKSKGPIHSYSFRLDNTMDKAFDYAWFNRIIMFLQRWWGFENDCSEGEVFGARAKPAIYLTHDVDAVSKTIAIRLKQTAFNLYNVEVRKASKFIFGSGDYWQFETIRAIEEKNGHTSNWNFYGGPGGWSRKPKALLMDPSYDVRSSRVVEQINELVAAGHTIGLHPSFDAWQNSDKILSEKYRLEQVLSRDVKSVRQHWLKFSFSETWIAQSECGLSHDFTLGFNDRVGFRNSAAVSFVDEVSGIYVTPMVLMDSHLYDYSKSDREGRCRKIDRILDELVATSGEASIIWHQRVFHDDYGWREGYEYLIDGMKKRQITSKNVS